MLLQQEKHPLCRFQYPASVCCFTFLQFFILQTSFHAVDIYDLAALRHIRTVAFPAGRRSVTGPCIITAQAVIILFISLRNSHEETVIIHCFFLQQPLQKHMRQIPHSFKNDTLPRQCRQGTSHPARFRKAGSWSHTGDQYQSAFPQKHSSPQRSRQTDPLRPHLPKPR